MGLPANLRITSFMLSSIKEASMRITLAAVACVFGLTSLLRAQTAQSLEPSSKLAELAQQAVKKTMEQFSQDKIKDEEIAVTVIDLHDQAHLTSGSYRGDQPIFP